MPTDSQFEPRVPLAAPPTPDTDSTVAFDTPGTPLVDLSAHGAEPPPSDWPCVPGFRVLREIAHGGMGIVYAAWDESLNREVAVKTILPRLVPQSHYAAQFDREARITALLPHPGVPPVHALGRLADGRPFLAMKLIHGRTLDAELGAIDRVASLPRLLTVFEQVCQAVGYAHSVGVIHRDLKPLNVMVSEFGEVQVMDWGIAKVLGRSYVTGASEGEDPSTAVGKDTDGEEATQPGQMKGTWAYVSPEQAKGEWDRVDVRSDVFALGSILCVLLTGKPAYTRGGFGLVRQAGNADLADAFVRLDGCGVDPELVALCKRCLASEPSGRPANGRAVADAVATHRAGVEERARRAETERAAAEARATEEANTRREAVARADAEERARVAAEAETREQRKRRRAQLALGALAAVLLSSAGGFAWWQDRQNTDQKIERDRVDTERRIEEARLKGETDKERELKAEQARVGVASGLTLATSLRKQYRFKEAAAALASALELARSGVPTRIAEVEQAQRDLAFVVQLDSVRYRKWAWIAQTGGKGDFNTRIASPEYRKAFADRGLNLTTLNVDEAAKRITASSVKAELVAAVDDWALYEPDDALRDRLLSIACTADPGEWTDRLRNPDVRKDRAAVQKLAIDADLSRTSSTALNTLTNLMERHGLDPSPMLTVARGRYPSDFELAFTLGQWHTANSKDGQQIGPYEAARALRPENQTAWNNLGIALLAKGDVEGAIASHKKAIQDDPKDGKAHNNLGVALVAKGDGEGAIAAFQEAIKHDPKLAQAHYNLGLALIKKGDVEGAIVRLKEAIKHDPKIEQVHNNLGFALSAKGDLEGAIAEYKEAIKHDPKNAAAHYNLGSALKARGDVEGAISAYKEAIKHDPQHARAHYNLGVALQARRDVEGAISAYKEAIKHDPQHARAHCNLGGALYSRNDVEGAIDACKKAIEIDPRHVPAYYNLGLSLHAKGDLEGSIAAYKKTIELDPRQPTAHVNLGSIYLYQKKYVEAIASARAAIKADPTFSNAHAMLGSALQQTGDLPGARAALTEAARLDPRWKGMLARLPPIPVAPPPRPIER